MSLVLVGTPAQAAVLAHWKFDEGTSNGGEVTVDELGNHNGSYVGGLFGTGNLFRTGVDGTPSAAVEFAQGYSVQIAAPPDPNLAKLIDTWPTLQEPVKAGIKVMVKASRSFG